jgi:hypothetical protein
MRSSAQRPRQRHVWAGFQLRGGADWNTAVGERPTGAVLAGVLNAEVEDSCIGDRSLGLGPIELLDMDAMLQHL